MSKAHKRAKDSLDLGANIENNDKARPKGVTASLRPLSTGRRPVAIVPPAEKVQLAPVVQPLALVPYSSQKQPLFIQEEQKVTEPSSQPYIESWEEVHTKPIIVVVMIALCAIALALMVIGDFLLKNVLSLTNGQGVIYIGISLFVAVAQGSLITIGNIVEVVLLAVFLLYLVLLIVLISLINKGVNIAVKVLAFIIAVLQMGTAIFCFNAGSANFGIYISAGWALAIMMLSFLAKRASK